MSANDDMLRDENIIIIVLMLECYYVYYTIICSFIVYHKKHG